MKTRPREGVPGELPLAGEHGVAHPAAGHQLPVEDGDEPPGGLHQDTVGHGDHRGHAAVEEAAGHGGGGVLLGHGALAGLEEDQGHPVVPHHPGELVRLDDLGAALLDLLQVGGVLEA